MVAMVVETGTAKQLLTSTDGRQRREYLPISSCLRLLHLYYHYDHYQPQKETCASLQGSLQISLSISSILSGTQ